MSVKAGEPPNNVIQERELRISCLQPPLGVSTSGPDVVVQDAGFAIDAEVLDSGRKQEPVSWQWVCMAASGAPCFEGYDVPDTSANTLRVEPVRMLLPGDYIIKVRGGMLPQRSTVSGRGQEPLYSCSSLPLLSPAFAFGIDGRFWSPG